MKRGLDRRQRQSIHHFQRRRHQSAPDQPGHRLAGFLDRGEQGQSSAHRFGQRQQPHGDFGHYAKRPFGADRETRQVEAWPVRGLAAQADQAAVVQDHLDAQHVIDRDAERQAVRPARVVGHVAADGAGLLARRIRREE